MHNFWDSFTNTFNNREIALIFWLLVVFVFAIFKIKGFLKDVVSLIKGFVDVIFIQFTFWIYLLAIVVLFRFVGLWNTNMVKDSVIFLLITALVLVMKVATERKGKKSLKEIISDAVKPIILAEFITNLESFSLIGELILLPVLLTLYVGAYTKTNVPNEKDVAKGSNVVLTILSLVMLGYGIHHLYTHWPHWNTSEKQQTIRNFLFPALATLAFMPYLYFAMLFFDWDERRRSGRR